MTPHQYANQWCEKRGYCLIKLINSKQQGYATKLESLIIDMRMFTTFWWSEISAAVHRSVEYCKAVWFGRKKRAA